MIEVTNREEYEKQQKEKKDSEECRRIEEERQRKIKEERRIEYEKRYANRIFLNESLRKPDKYGNIYCKKCCSIVTAQFGYCPKCHTQFELDASK